MLKRRLIPKLQMKAKAYGSRTKMVLVTTKQFDASIEIGDPISQAKIYQAQAVDELILLDISAEYSESHRAVIMELLSKIAEHIFMPITVGGGIRSIADFRMLLNNGADKISINTGAVQDSDLITQAAQIYGSQCVVVSIDYRQEPNGKNYVWINGGKTKTDLDPVEWAVAAAQRGAGEILLTCINNDGMGNGLDLAVIKQVTDKVPIPVIAAGGCGLASHFIDGFLQGRADAIAAGTFFCFKDQNPIQTRAHIKNAGIPIRTYT